MISSSEKLCIDKRYSYCDAKFEDEDYILVYPSLKLSANIERISNSIRLQWNVIKDLSQVNPTSQNTDRVVIGYRHPNDENGQECAPGYLRHEGTPFINIPWSFADKCEQPEGCLSHELVHVFLDVSPIMPDNLHWREGTCDFMRLFALHASGHDKIARSKSDCYRLAAYSQDADFYHDYAGRLLLQLERRGGDTSDLDCSRKIVGEFWQANLETLIPKSNHDFA